MKEILSREMAMILGHDRYFSGKPCPRGHIADRYIGRQCVECYPRKISAYEKSKQATRKAQKRYVEKNREAIAARVKAYNQANPEKKYLRDKAWREANPERVRAHGRASYYSNPARARAKSANYRAMKMRATPDWMTEQHHAQIAAIYEDAARKTALTGIVHEVDHIVPLAGENVCGLHVPWNLKAITRSANRRKSNSLIEQQKTIETSDPI